MITTNNSMAFLTDNLSNDTYVYHYNYVACGALKVRSLCIGFGQNYTVMSISYTNLRLVSVCHKSAKYLIKMIMTVVLEY